LLLVGAGVLFGGGYWYLTASLPPREGTIWLAGLRSEVRIYWDERGVPHIEAAYPEDLFFAQGYVTAQDRLWQMDVYRRTAAGRMAEILGESSLEQDMFFRTLGLRQAAEASLALATPEARQMAEAYAAGVTAYIEHVKGTRLLPIEFRLLGYEPEPWTAVDSLLIARLMAYYLSGNWELELQRYLIAETVGWDCAARVVAGVSGVRAHHYYVGAHAGRHRRGAGGRSPRRAGGALARGSARRARATAARGLTAGRAGGR
jgi:Protein related to penicillin acylase